MLKLTSSRGLLQLILAVSCVLAILINYHGLVSGSNQILDSQTQQLGRSLSSLAAQNASVFIGLNQHEQLGPIAEALAEQPSVFDATFYDHLGRTIARSDNALPLNQLLPLGGARETPLPGFGRRPYVALVTGEDGKTLGYLRITLEERMLRKDATTFLLQSQTKLGLMLLMVFVLGLVFTRKRPKKKRWVSSFQMKHLKN